MKGIAKILLIMGFLGGLSLTALADSAGNLRLIKLPPGFSISLYAKVPGARSLAVVSERGIVVVGSRGDSVHIIHDKGLKGHPERVSLLRDDLSVPNGIAVKGNDLFIAEQHRLIRIPLDTPKKETVLIDDLPDDRWHGWRYAAFGPNGKLYVSIGAPCNVCRVTGREGSIIEVDPDNGANRIFARGIRNSVGIDFHPVTGALYFTDNGSDGLGDDIPPDELNHAPRPGLHFGFPWFGGGTVSTEEFEDVSKPKDTISPMVSFQAHTASLGLHFYEGRAFPNSYNRSAFVAQHGSWNRSTPIGYRIMHLTFDHSGRFLEKTIFAEGWLQKDGKWGRPVDLKQLPDGSLLISDDHAGAVYRITYKN